MSNFFRKSYLMLLLSFGLMNVYAQDNNIDTALTEDSNAMLDSVLITKEKLVFQKTLVFDTVYQLFSCKMPLDSSLVLNEFIIDSAVYKEGWDSLLQIRFWKYIMNLSEDSALVSNAKTREVLHRFPSVKYEKLSVENRKKYKSDLLKDLALPDTTLIYVTYGKKEFYRIADVMKNLDTAIKIFRQEGISPWYSQAIMLIESPARTQKSWAGAYGPFQLLKSVGRKYGLTINKETDERTNLTKSAHAAAKFIKNDCIPNAERLLRQYKISYAKEDLWFRLFVMHVYHAGTANVAAALKVIQPADGGMQLIKTLWQTKAANFKNASQNYSQVALAATLILYDLLFFDAGL